MATSVRRTTLTLPAAPIGPDNPLPALRAADDRTASRSPQDAGLPADMARQIGYRAAALDPARADARRLRPRPRPTDIDALVIENDRLRATVLPGLGGRVYSLHHKPTDRELLYRNPVLQPANFALNGAWFSGGIEWNIGATGHTTLACAPLHAARVPAPDGGEMLRLWEWERLRDLPFQVDLWLPEGSDFLHVGVRIRNPHHHTAPVYWWSNIAVPEGARDPCPGPRRRGLALRLRAHPAPRPGPRSPTAPTAPTRCAATSPPTTSTRSPTAPAAGSPPSTRTAAAWCRPPPTRCAAASSSCGARGGPGGAGSSGSPSPAPAATPRSRRVSPVPSWSMWRSTAAASSPGWRRTGRWPPTRRPCTATTGARPATRSRPGWRAALPRADVDAAYAAWRPYADHEPKEPLATGSGWGALEVARAGLDLPGTPFDADTLGAEQQPWLTLLRTGDLPAEAPRPDRRWSPRPGAICWSPPGRARPTDYHLGLAQWHAGDRAQAVRSWERALGRTTRARLPLYCLAVAESEAGRHRARRRPLRARRSPARRTAPRTPPHRTRPARVWRAALPALAREAVPALLADGRSERGGGAARAAARETRRPTAGSGC